MPALRGSLRDVTAPGIGFALTSEDIYCKPYHSKPLRLFVTNVVEQLYTWLRDETDRSTTKVA